MHAVLAEIKKSLEKLIGQVQEAISNDEPFGNASGNWSFPGLTRSELIGEAQAIVDLIDCHGGDDVGDGENHLHDYVRRIQHLRQHTVGQLAGNAGQAVPAYLITLQGLNKALAAAIPADRRTDSTRLRKVSSQIRAMEARIKDLDPRTTSLNAMVERIEKANDAADQLPTDLESLSEARQKIARLADESAKGQAEITRLREESEAHNETLQNCAEEASSVLEKCEMAYSAATSLGLAAAFSERSNRLSRSMWVWVVGLIGALATGSIFGSAQLRNLSGLLMLPDASSSVIVLNLLLSMLSVGAPVWFAWLATKQIGQRFRLAEDYAFKASISRAYEGFRREAARVDKDMEAKLLASALTRLDELPLRLVETVTHGSPWQELAASNVVRQALRSVPGFVDDVKGLASSSIIGLARKKPKRDQRSEAAPDPNNE